MIPSDFTVFTVIQFSKHVKLNKLQGQTFNVQIIIPVDNVVRRSVENEIPK